MIFVALQVLTAVSFRAQMDLTFFGTDEEKLVVTGVGVEVKAHTASKAVKECFLFGVKEFFLLVDNELKLDDFLSFEVVLHQVPVSDSTI